MSERKYLLSAETTCDMPAAFYSEHNVHTLHLTYSYGESEQSLTDTDEDFKIFYKKVREGAMPRTSQIPMTVYYESFEKHIKDGYDIVHIALSSGISSTHNSCCVAAKELMEEYPEAKVYVIDSLSASMGEGLLLTHAIKLRDSGLDAKTLAERLDVDKQRFCHYFTVDDLNHLQRGGRVSKLTAVVGTAFGIKPGLHMDAEGKLIPIAKIRGRKQSVAWLAECMEKKVVREDNDVIYISHGDCLEDAEMLRDMIKERMGFEKFMISHIGPVVGAHSGPGTLALFFIGANRDV